MGGALRLECRGRVDPLPNIRFWCMLRKFSLETYHIMFKPSSSRSSGSSYGKGAKKFGDSNSWERGSESRSSGGSRGGFNDRNGEKPMMHKATCADCGKSCEIPFRPDGRRDVFCSLCFRKDDNTEATRGGGNSEYRKPAFEKRSFDSFDKPSFKAVCEQCGNSCTVPFRPTGSKPVYCSACFGGVNAGSSSFSAPAPRMNSDQYASQFKIINSKLDAIMRILSPSSSLPSLEQEVEQLISSVEPVERIVKEKKVSKKKNDDIDSLDITL